MGFVENLNRIIYDKGLSQSEVARRVGVRPSQVSAWLSGMWYPRQNNNYEKLLKALDVTREELGELPPTKADIAKMEKSKKQKKEITSNKVKPCFNQKCYLNDKCFCQSVIVIEGRGSCASQYNISDKPYDKDKELKSLRSSHVKRVKACRERGLKQNGGKE